VASRVAKLEIEMKASATFVIPSRRSAASRNP